MKKFKYLIEYFGSHEMQGLEMDRFLNDMGIKGWELVQIIIGYFHHEPTSVSNYKFIFKKECLELES